MGFFHAVSDTLGYWSSAMLCGIAILAGVFALIMLRSSLKLILTTLILVACTGAVLWWMGYRVPLPI